MKLAQPSQPGPSRPEGGIARYFVEHREVAWAALVAVMVWGWIAYHRLAQQEDPKIPERRALLVTRFPGANTLKLEQLVSKKLEKKITELPSIEEIKSQSRNGISVMEITLRSGTQAAIEQEWDKLRAKVNEIPLPEGCQPPGLDTDFGNTITLLYSITSPAISDAECQARASLVRSRLRQVRAGGEAAGSAAVVAFFPEAISREYRASTAQRFTNQLVQSGLGRQPRMVETESFVLADFQTTATKAQLCTLLEQFHRRMAGTEGMLHPDFISPIVLMGDEDPLPSIRQTAWPRYSYRELEKAAEMVEDELKQDDSVGRVRRIGTVEEMVYLLFSTAKVTGYNLTSDEVIRAIAARNAIIPGGNLLTEGQNFPVQLSGEFQSESDLLGATIGISRSESGNPRSSNTPILPIYLRDLFEVRRGYENPIPYQVDVLQRNHQGKLTEHRAVLLGVEMKEGKQIGKFDEQVRTIVEKTQTRLPDGLVLTRISNQPQAVAERVQQFTRCFIEALVIIILAALFLMEWRSALVVAIAIPLTVAMTLGGMHLFNIPLHQISIAALIISLGMLVDDPVVASDGINRELAHGEKRMVAAWLGPFKLRRPIFFATAVNIFAFLPLVLLPSDKGAFIFALPAVVTLALVSSRVVSMTFIPLVGFYLLRGQKGFEAGGNVRSFPLFAAMDRLILALLPFYKRTLNGALEQPWKAVLLAYGVLLASFTLTPLLGQQFFPPAERNQLLIDVELTESASISQTREVCRQISTILINYDEIVSAAIFSGGTAPRFYYNVSPREPASYLAQILVNTRKYQDVPSLMARLRVQLDEQVHARCLVKQLEQGPPVDSPIQIRVLGTELDTLRDLADRVSQILRTNGAYQVNDDLGKRMPTLQLDIAQDRANTLGINNSDVGRLAQAAFTGVKVTELREGDHLIPVVIRLRVEDRNEADKIRSLYAESVAGELVPVDNFARLSVKPEYATIGHFNQLRAVTVKAYSTIGELPSTVMARAWPILQRMPLPPGYKMESAGEAKELRESQSEMAGVMAISLSLIALSLVLQFNSVTKAIVVLLTVPLGLIGALVGLAITQAALGFMALLGMVSLAGVIVSHIIVLSDFIEEARAEGMELKTALMQAGMVRLRAVMVTVLATVCGLMPLALTGGDLWKPLTAVHIFGLLLATVLTLVLLPAWYFIGCGKLKWIK